MQGLCGAYSQLQPLYTPDVGEEGGGEEGEDEEGEERLERRDGHDPEGGDLSEAKDEEDGGAGADDEEFPPGSIVWAR